MSNWIRTGKENDLEKVREMKSEGNGKRDSEKKILFQKNDREILDDEGKRDGDLSSHFHGFVLV